MLKTMTGGTHKGRPADRGRGVKKLLEIFRTGAQNAVLNFTNF